MTLHNTLTGLVSALGGFVLWLVLLSYGEPGDIFELVFLFSPLVIVPLAMYLIQPWLQDSFSSHIYRIAGILQPITAVSAVVSFQVGRGTLAAVLATAWLLLTCLFGVCGISLFIRAKRRSLSFLCVVAAFLYLPVGGIWLVTSRFGTIALGFQEPIILLTAIHFHYTGFAAILLAALAENFFSENSPTARRIFPFASLGTLAGTPLLAIGFVFSPLLKVVAAIVLTAGLSALALIYFISLRRISSVAAAIFLATSAGSIVAGLFLALVYAWGEYKERLLIGISEMAWTHGILNAFGFVFCGLLGWVLERKRYITK